MSAAVSTATDGPDGETANQRQARLRREKRQKKMTEQGEDRLAKIKALNGGVAPPDEVLGGPVAQPTQTTYGDPDEVDIDTISGSATPGSKAQVPHVDAQKDPLMAAMLQMQQEETRRNAAGQGTGDAQDSDDPMVRMMQQLTGMMGGNPQNPNDPNQPPQLPPMLQAMMNGGGQGAQVEQGSQSNNAHIWRIVHVAFAFALAAYTLATSTFVGSKVARSQSALTQELNQDMATRLFWIFTTVEIMLHSSRYVIEKGQLQGTGWLATIANSGVIPEPYGHYIRTLGRYVSILQITFADAMVLVFTLGAVAWWQEVSSS